MYLQRGNALLLCNGQSAQFHHYRAVGNKVYNDLPALPFVSGTHLGSLDVTDLKPSDLVLLKVTDYCA